MITVQRKIPPFHEIVSLYATIVFLIYSWAFVTFFWKVRSWLYFLKPGELVAIFSYTLSSAFWECTIVLFVFLMAGLILPARIFSEKFLLRGSVVIYVSTFWVALFNLNSLIQLPTTSEMLSFGAVSLFTMTLALILVDRVFLLQKWLIAFADRLRIFLYLSLPLSAVSMLFILVRIG